MSSMGYPSGPGDDAIRSPMDSRLTSLQSQHNIRRSKSGGLAGDRQRLYEVLEERGAGSVLRGWRRDLDPEGLLRVGFQDFCKAMAGIGIQVNTLRLFASDGEPDTFGLDDLAPMQAAVLERFREWVKTTFGGPAGMFAAFDTDGLGYISREGFVDGCKERRFRATENDLQELFNCLDFDNGGSVTMDEIMFLELDPAIRDTEMFKLKMRSKFQRQRLLAYAHWEDGHRYSSNKHRCAQRPWLAQAFETLPVLVCQRRLEKQQDAYKKSVDARVAFLKHLRGQYSNEVRAWRRGLDPECNFRMNRMMLRQYCRQHDLGLDFTALWSGMDRDGDDYVSLEEITSSAAAELAGFRSWAHRNFGSCAAIWDLPELIDVREKALQSGRWVSDKKMLIGSVAEALRGLGWPGSAGSLLYQSLDLYGCGFLSLPDFWWLDAWDPPEWLVEHPDPQAMIELQACVQAAYPHSLTAWRALLDQDSDNQVSWAEFQHACRKLRFRGNVGAAWRCLDRDVSGTITLREWDPAGAELLGSFKKWAEKHFGSVELAFKSFDKDGAGFLTLSDLKQACRRLKWDGDVRLLFNCLGIKPGKDENKPKQLSLADIAFIDSWVELDELKFALQELKGGGKRCSSVPTSPVSKALSMRICELASPKHRVSFGGVSSVGGGAERSEDGSQADVESRVSDQRAPSENEKLHRTYHVMAKRKRPPRTATRSKSLSWLEKINSIDTAYA